MCVISSRHCLVSFLFSAELIYSQHVPCEGLVYSTHTPNHVFTRVKLNYSHSSPALFEENIEIVLGELVEQTQIPMTDHLLISPYALPSTGHDWKGEVCL